MVVTCTQYTRNAKNLVTMTSEHPPTIDPVAAKRWAEHVQPLKSAGSPWLHEEVARRMQARLAVIVQQPQNWVHWRPLQGGLQAHALLSQRYPESQCYVLEQTQQQTEVARKHLTPAWWRSAPWRRGKPEFQAPSQPCQMLWANMALHMASDPYAVMQQWHHLLAVDGFVMFSCLGPDTLTELRSVYAKMGWPAPAHAYTDMHDWGDMLVQAGFAEPVMDMERIRLTYSSAANLLHELRQMGRNLHTSRHIGMRGRQWRDTLYHAINTEMQQNTENGRMALTFEVIYGHAFKPQPRIKMQTHTTFTLEQMQTALRNGKDEIKNKPHTP